MSLHSTETAPPPPAVLDPSLMAGALDPTLAEQLPISFHTFEEAQAKPRELPDRLVEDFIADTQKVGDEKVGVKGFMDKLEQTETDREVISSPDRIAGLYLNTMEMIGRNIKLYTKNATPELKAEAAQAKADMLSQLKPYALEGADTVVARATGTVNSSQLKHFQLNGLLRVNGKDLLDISENKHSEVQSNITVQRQAGGQFIMGYSDNFLRSRGEGNEPQATRRIYLNPEMEATPEIFEKLLQTANEAGLTLNLKMLQRSYEAANDACQQVMGKQPEGLRGDGIVIYTNDTEANDVLALVTAVAQDHAEDFKDRSVSRLATRVTSGVGVGDEPGIRGESLTSHRIQAINYAADYVRNKLGLERDEPIPADKRQQAINGFRKVFERTCEANNIDPRNMSFNVTRQGQAAA